MGFHYTGCRSDALNLTSLKERPISPHILWNTFIVNVPCVENATVDGPLRPINESQTIPIKLGRWLGYKRVADPDLELRWRGGRGGGDLIDLLDLLALPANFPSVMSSFLTQNKGGRGGGAGPPGPSSRSATASNTISFIMTTLRKYYTVDMQPNII